MHEFSDELMIVESYKIPWLIWIQLVITFLLIILLFFGFSLFTVDSSTPSSSSASQSTLHSTNPSTSSHSNKSEENQRNKGDAGTSRGSSIGAQDGEESGLKDSSLFLRFFRQPNHPCNYFGQAKQALLRCFGLDPGSDNPTNQRHAKQD